MRVTVYYYALQLSDFNHQLNEGIEVALQRTVELLQQKEVPQRECEETLTIVRDTAKGVFRSEVAETLNALCWFLEANAQKIELTSLADWKYRYFEELGLHRLRSNRLPDWLPATCNGQIPGAIYLTSGEGIANAIADLSANESGEEDYDEFQESRDELIDVFDETQKAGEDAIVIFIVS